jgi:HAD superfamily hydrolase (TIGR01509 family)
VAGRALLFDVDGTLLDSNYLHALAWWRALDDAGERRPMAVLHKLIGMGSSRLLQEAVGRDDAALSESHGHHYQRLKGELTALPGARDLLARAKKAGAIVVLATSAKPRDLGDLLGVLDADDLIDHVIHSGDVEQAKPAGDIFAAALERAGCPPDQALAVGDTIWDVEAAGRAGVGCVCVLTGGNARGELLEAGALAVYDDAAALVNGFETSPLGQLMGAPLKEAP